MGRISGILPPGIAVQSPGCAQSAVLGWWVSLKDQLFLSQRASVREGRNVCIPVTSWEMFCHGNWRAIQVTELGKKDSSLLPCVLTLHFLGTISPASAHWKDVPDVLPWPCQPPPLQVCAALCSKMSLCLGAQGTGSKWDRVLSPERI